MKSPRTRTISSSPKPVHKTPPSRRSRAAKIPAVKEPEVVSPVVPSPLAKAGPPFPLSTIVVPIDFSSYSKYALRYAVPLAETFGARLHLVFVVEPTIYPADLGFGQVVLPGVEKELKGKAEEELQALIEREIGTRARASASVRIGSPHQEILDEADDQHADFIVVAAHGHSAVEQLLFGSTADRIVHHASVPVLVVKASPDGEATRD